MLFSAVFWPNLPIFMVFYLSSKIAKKFSNFYKKMQLQSKNFLSSPVRIADNLEKIGNKLVLGFSTNFWHHICEKKSRVRVPLWKSIFPGLSFVLNMTSQRPHLKATKKREFHRGMRSRLFFWHKRRQKSIKKPGTSLFPIFSRLAYIQG